MDMGLVLKYLEDLSENNNREWYHAHKMESEAACTQFEKLVRTLIFRIREFDSTILHNQAEDCIFKLVRYPRFGHDRSPFNPSFRAHISVQGKRPVPVGYYLMVRPGGQSFLRGGLSTNMFRDATVMIRDYIAEHGDEFGEIIHSPEFLKYFAVQGTALKNVPAGYDKEHPQAEYLKFKSWYLKYPVADEALNDSEVFIEKTVRLFRIMKPFNDYLNKALDGFQMPAR